MNDRFLPDFQPRVDVIIPTHNRWPMVADAIRSVLSQTHSNTGCIVVDDGSTDGTADQIRQAFGDSVRLLVNPQSREKSSSRNRGVRESEAEFVCFLDSDDKLLPRAVEDRLAVFRTNPDFNGVVYGYTVAEDESGPERGQPGSSYSPTLYDYLDDKDGLRTNSFMLRREVMLGKGMYNERLTNREDIELFIRLFCQVAFTCCGTVVSHYRKAASERARDNWRKIIEQGTALTDSIGADQTLLNRLGAVYQTLRTQEYQELLRAHYRHKNYADYQAIFRKAQALEGLDLPFKYHRRQWLAIAFSALRGE